MMNANSGKSPNPQASPAARADSSDAAAARLRWWRGMQGLAWLLLLVVVVQPLAFPPRHFGFAQAIATMLCVAVPVYEVEKCIYPRLPWSTLWLPAMLLAALLSLLFPGRLLPPQASAWMPLHWAFGMCAYAMLALAVVHAGLLQRRSAQLRQPSAPAVVQPGHGADMQLALQRGLPLLTLERLMFSFVLVGLVLLTISITLGFVFLAWHVEHKTVFALLSWGLLALLMLGRHMLGWRGKRAIYILYGGALLLLLSYAGSRFVLEVLLQRMA